MMIKQPYKLVHVIIGIDHVSIPSTSNAKFSLHFTAMDSPIDLDEFRFISDFINDEIEFFGLKEEQYCRAVIQIKEIYDCGGHWEREAEIKCFSKHEYGE